MGLLSKYSRLSSGVIGTLTLVWAATWLTKGYYIGGMLIAFGGYAALPWETSRKSVTFGQLGVGGFWTEKIAFVLWVAFLLAGLTAIAAAGGLPTS